MKRLKENNINYRAEFLSLPVAPQGDRPTILNGANGRDRKELMRLISKKGAVRVVDDLSEEKRELAVVRRPSSMTHASLTPSFAKKRASSREGVWVYYPWRRTLAHILKKDAYYKLRISRNQNLILPSEQKKFEKFKIGIAGLNVGNPAAICIALEGGGNEMKFADNDVLTLSNLNRFRAGIPDLGINKSVLSARQVYEINPFAKINVFPQGIQGGKEENFLLNPKIDLLIEEMDNMRLKISIREKARSYRIPVLMVTGNGENVIIDIERFDLNPRLSILNSYLKPGVIKRIEKIKPAEGTFRERVLCARDFMGAKYLTRRLRQSFLLVGTRLAGIPQIAESSFLRGAALCYFARKIAQGARISSGRYYLRLDSIVK